MLGNDREREKRSGLEARKKLLLYSQNHKTAEKRDRVFKKRKKEEEKKYNKWKNNDMAKSKGKSEEGKTKQ